ncbi:MAG: tetratricopeptide repeat protein [Candidatus Latescibacteria bacterium]|nr:tetratricopeptide repeat protein [Candidatus Latescibacterota bacterium]NIM66222.1 tetratricopeptide repeat protein [Candidatus Latescibacterota bacterium]NIO01856.1 tetratricopeptide repeat protein [Candidatus Latescibacterota bacterium]NIO29501.1 tetratricopeptide repeat protein [Candidatus Latescibacterota bacterium]NIT02027.1 tetratricopeptide repeat protein [Candidatus Latescibacterota bacterium]
MRKPQKIVVLLITLVFFRCTSEKISAAEPQPDLATQAAEELYNTGYLLTMLGQYEQAIQLLEQSLVIKPTAEAYTYLGWTYSHMGNLKRAIEEAKKAIRIDPDFGNPYNDIGVYLIEQGKEDEAIPYLEKALAAKRYCCYQFPHYNLGRIYLKKKMYDRAREAFKKSLEVDPTYAPAREALEILKEVGLERT